MKRILFTLALFFAEFAFSDRRPAVLPNDDPSVSDFFKPAPISFDSVNAVSTAKGFENRLSDLSSRTFPYSIRDYADFRDFISAEKDLLSKMEFSATHFRRKATELFGLYGKRDVSNANRSKKEAFQHFIAKTSPPPAAPLLVEGRSRAKGRPVFGWGHH